MVLQITPSLAARIERLTENGYFPFLREEIAQGVDFSEEDLLAMESLKSDLEVADYQVQRGMMSELTDERFEDLLKRARARFETRSSGPDAAGT
jgi:hypothetical protein